MGMFSKKIYTTHCQMFHARVRVILRRKIRKLGKDNNIEKLIAHYNLTEMGKQELESLYNELSKRYVKTS